MALVFADRVQETTTTGFAGTGDVQLNGVPASPLGRVTFAAGVGDGNRCKFLIDDSQGNWEISEGAVTTTGSPHTLTRDRVIASSVSGAKVNFLAGMKDVTLVATSEDVGRSPHGQCRLTLDGTDLKLSRHNGKWLIVDGEARELPAGGVLLSATGLSASTTYFIYASTSAGTVSLEASTTGHALDSQTGVETMSGDTSRTLVGMARTNPSAGFVDTAENIFVVSWFNRRQKLGRRSDPTGYTHTSATWTEATTNLRVEFVCWDAQAKAQVTCKAGSNFGNGGGLVAVGIDGTTNRGAEQRFQGEANSNNSLTSFTSASYDSTHYGEGYHYATLLFSRVASDIIVFSSETQVDVWG